MLTKVSAWISDLPKSTCAESRPVEALGLEVSVANVEDSGELLLPSTIGSGDVFAGIGFESVDPRNVRGDTHRMHQGGSGTSKVLHAAEHLELLRGCRHEQGLGLPFAGFQRSTGITHFTRQEERLEIGERLVDHHWAEFGCFEHGVPAVGLEIAGSGLFDVLHQVKSPGCTLL